MKIITSSPVLKKGKIINPGYSCAVGPDVEYAEYSNADAKKKKKAPKGLKAKVKGAVTKARNSGLADSIKTLGKEAINKKLGIGQNSTPSDSGAGFSTAPEQEPMSMTKKLVIGGAVALVLGIGIYMAVKK